MSISRKVRQAGSGLLEDQPDYHDRYVQNWWFGRRPTILATALDQRTVGDRHASRKSGRIAPCPNGFVPEVVSERDLNPSVRDLRICAAR